MSNLWLMRQVLLEPHQPSDWRIRTTGFGTKVNPWSIGPPKPTHVGCSFIGNHHRGTALSDDHVLHHILIVEIT